MKYTETQKTEALDFYLSVGTAETHRRTGIPTRTILDWASKAGVIAQAPDEKMVEARALRHAEKREVIRELLLDRTADFLENMDATNPRGVQSLATSVGILIDKYRLEMGEATSRAHVESADDIDRAVRQLVGEMASRSETETP